NKSADPLTVTSDDDSKLTLRYLQIDVADGAVVDMAGALNIGDGMSIRGFGSPDALRLSNRHNRFGEWLRLALDHSAADEDGSRKMTVGDIVIRSSNDPLAVDGDFHGSGDVFIWNDGGNVILRPLSSLSADGVLTVAA